MHSFPPQHLMDFNNDFLLNQIKNQVEFYFAPQNLQNDKFLQSQLNATDHLGAVSINVICSFRKIRQLYSYSRSGYYPLDVDMPADPALLRMALATSSVVSISHDGMWVVPNLQRDPQKDSATEATVASVPSSPSSSQEGAPQQDRCTIVLHDIANTVTEAMVLETFAKYNPKAARSEAGDTWHVTFGSSGDAAASLEAGIKLDDKLIQGSLKADISNVPSMPLPPPAQQAPMVGNDPNAMGYYGQYRLQPPPQYNYVPIQYGMPQMAPPYPMHPQYYPQPQYRYFAPPGQQRQGGPPPQNVFVRPNENNNRMRRRNQGNKRRNRRQDQPQQQDEKPKKESNNNNKTKKNQEKKEVKNLDLSKEHFPSLGGKETLRPMSTNIGEAAYAKALLKAASNTDKQSEKEPASTTRTT